jgi:hypothetical protein
LVVEITSLARVLALLIHFLSVGAFVFVPKFPVLSGVRDSQSTTAVTCHPQAAASTIWFDPFRTRR